MVLNDKVQIKDPVVSIPKTKSDKSAKVEV